jgi:hypothetical protein
VLWLLAHRNTNQRQTPTSNRHKLMNLLAVLCCAPLQVVPLTPWAWLMKACVLMAVLAVK